MPIKRLNRRMLRRSTHKRYDVDNYKIEKIEVGINKKHYRAFVTQSYYPYISIYLAGEYSRVYMEEAMPDAIYNNVGKSISIISRIITKIYENIFYIDDNFELIKKTINSVLRKDTPEIKFSIYNEKYTKILDNWEKIFENTSLKDVSTSCKIGYIRYILSKY